MTALGSLADPAVLDPEDGRSPQQRRADALTEICVQDDAESGAADRPGADSGRGG